MKITAGDEARFWSKVRKTRGCWYWTAYLDKDGYGHFGLGNTVQLAHRTSYQIAKGETKLCVCHTCDNPACVNPKHLFTGTMKDNVRDCMRKGRRAKEERRNRSKLTRRQVIQVIRNAGKVRNNVMAEKFGVHIQTIRDIINCKTWSFIKRNK